MLYWFCILTTKSAELRWLMPQIFNILLVARILYNNLILSWILCFIYQLIHPVPWNRYIKNLFLTILQSVWHSRQHPGPQMKLVTFLFMLFLFLRQFWFFILGRQTSSLPHPTATCLLYFWGNAVINWLYSWIEQTFLYNSDNSMKYITLPFQFTISFKNKIPFSFP
jgi:hypothetical protein